MKWFFCLMLISFNLFAQVEMLKTADQKTYTPRLKGITDLVIDVESDKIKNQLNEQRILGNIKQLIFRFYWTAQPERLAVEVLGLPEGFKEIKEEIQQSVMKLFEDVIPLPLEKKFSNFTLTKKADKKLVAKSKDSLAIITTHDFIFDDQDRLKEIISHRPVGEMSTSFIYDRTSFSDGKWVIKAQKTQVHEGGQKISIDKEISYQVVAGAGFPEEVNVVTKQSGSAGNMEQVENYKFKNIQINKGEALKHFLGNK